MYNFRFDSDHPPTIANATVGFYKTRSPDHSCSTRPGVHGRITNSDSDSQPVRIADRDANGDKYTYGNPDTLRKLYIVDNDRRSDRSR